MRSYLPTDISMCTVPDLMKRAADAGMLYTTDFAEYLKKKRLLWWLVTHQDDIAKANFLQGANVTSFRELADYDILELRAVYAAIPATFQLDTTPGREGQKAAWRAGLVERLKGMTQHQREETIQGGWDPATNSRKQITLEPLPEAKRRGAPYFYATPLVAGERCAKFKALEDKLSSKRKRLAALVGDDGKSGLLAEAKGERDNATADARSEYLQEQYGKEVLKGLRDKASQAYAKLDKEQKTVEREIKSAELSISMQKPTRAEYEAEWEAVQAKNYHKPNDDADIAALAALAEGMDEMPDADELRRWYAGFGDARGRMIRGPFSPTPTIEKSKVKVAGTISDAEKKKQRMAEMSAAMGRREKPTTGIAAGVELGGAKSAADHMVKAGAFQRSAGVASMLQKQHRAHAAKQAPKAAAPVEIRSKGLAALAKNKPPVSPEVDAAARASSQRRMQGT